MTTEIPLFEIPWDERDVKNVIDSVTRGGYWAKGPYVSEFEDRLESYLGVEHAQVVNSGTTALECALRAAGIGPGDEVIVPSFTFIATANVVRLVGADPVFADIERNTYGLDPADVRERITDDTAAVMPVHVYGAACKIEQLAAIADEHDIVLIEDAAAALGADAPRGRVGTFGDLACFSFCQNKIVPTGEGGLVVTDDDNLAEQVALYRSHGRASVDYFDTPGGGEYVQYGSNYRMPDVVAAIGCAQMEKVETLIDGRRRAAVRYTAGFEDVPGVIPPSDDCGRHVYQLYSVAFESGLDRSKIIETLTDAGIASKIYWGPIHVTDLYEGVGRADAGSLPVTEDIANRVLSLPIHPEIDDSAIDRVVETVIGGVNRAR